MPFHDLRAYLEALRGRDLLYEIGRPVNKDTELMPLVRWQFRGLPEAERKAFLFHEVVDGNGRRFDGGVAVGLLGASRRVYTVALECGVEAIPQRWRTCLGSPVAPEPYRGGRPPVKEEIHKGERLLEHGGLLEFPIPISTPGFDPAPYITSGFWITRDAESGVRNVGTYRGMLKAPDRTGILIQPSQHIGFHWEQRRERGEPLEAALVIGGPPSLGLVSAAKIPYGTDELAVAGAVLGEPIPLVPCETVDLEVPAEAEIVVEGRIETDRSEPEGPFGEFTGYMGLRQQAAVFNVTGISHRKAPLFQAFISQFPPSESTKLREIAYASVLYKLLTVDHNIPSVRQVVVHEAGGSSQWVVIQMKKQHPAQPWQALNAAVAFDPTIGKILIAVDEDIDPNDLEAVVWALGYRMMPHRDMRVTMGKMSMEDFSAAPPGTPYLQAVYPEPNGVSALMIDATRKWPYPPTSLPARVYMEQARRIWEAEGLPPLRPRSPWFGYHLGHWPEEFAGEAAAAVAGGYLATGEKHARQTRFTAGPGVDASAGGFH